MKRRIPAGVALLALVALSAPARAQQRPPMANGWLGINLSQNYECRWDENDEWKACSLAMHVEGLQEGGPAASAGLELGDRLVAINGTDITYENWSGLMAGIRAGTPVSIDVMRADERHFVHVTPIPRPADPNALAWARRPVGRIGPDPGRSFVFTLTEPQGREGTAFAITVRDMDDDRVDVAPAAVRVVDGQLRLITLDEAEFAGFPNLRLELLGDLSEVSESTYQRATSALDVLDRMRERLESPEFRAQLARIASTGLAQPELAYRFVRSFGGAEFEPVRKGLLVLRVVPRTAAARVGLRSGDLVIRVGDRPVREVADLVRALGRRDAGAVRLHWIREGRELSEVWPGR